MKEPTENRKVRYTRRVIRESLFELLETQPLTKITVKRLCELADINRGTFYSHYADINDLVEKLEGELIASMTGAIPFEQIGDVNQRQMFTDVFAHIQARIDDFRLIFLNPDSSHCLDKIIASVYHYHAAALVRHDQPVSQNMIDYTFALLSSGCTQVILKWIENDFAETPEEMAELINRFAACGMAAYSA